MYKQNVFLKSYHYYILLKKKKKKQAKPYNSSLFTNRSCPLPQTLLSPQKPIVFRLIIWWMISA
jgi:hypothetical protein